MTSHKRLHIFEGNTQVLHVFVIHLAAEGYVVIKLSVLGLRLRCSVEMDNSVNNTQGLSGQTYTALHVIVASVGGAYYHFSENLGVAQHILAAVSVAAVVNQLLLFIGHALCRFDVGITFLKNLLTNAVTRRAEVGVCCFEANGVACGEVEHNNVIELHISESLHAAVLPLRKVGVTLSTAKEGGHRVLRKRHRQWRARNGRTVTQLTHTEVVAHKHGLFQ